MPFTLACTSTPLLATKTQLDCQLPFQTQKALRPLMQLGLAFSGKLPLKVTFPSATFGMAVSKRQLLMTLGFAQLTSSTQLQAKGTAIISCRRKVHLRDPLTNISLKVSSMPTVGQISLTRIRTFLCQTARH